MFSRPMFRYEYQATTRKRRPFVFRTAFTAVLGLVALLIGLVMYTANSGYDTQTRLLYFGRSVFVGQTARGWGSRGGNQKTYDPWLKSNAGGGPPANYAAIVKSDAHGMIYPASPYLPANDLTAAMDRLMPQIFDNALPVRNGLQQIDQETNAKLEPAAKAAGAPAKPAG